MKVNWKKLWIKLGMGALVSGFSLGLGDYLCKYALNRDFDGASSAEDRKNSMKKWLYHHAADTYLKSSDGLLLHAHYLKAREPYSHRYVIICHGYKHRGSDMGREAQHFYEQGFHILCPDARGHGESEGNYIGMGWNERKDLSKWIRYLLRRDDEAQIVLYGVSMGAATVMMASGERLPSEVKAAVEDCGYTSAWSQFRYQLRRQFHLPPFPFLYAASFVSWLRYDFGFREASARRQVARKKIPMLFIHGDADDFVPFRMLNKLFETAAGEKEKLVIHEAGHAECEKKAPDLYWDTVDRFIGQYIHGDEPYDSEETLWESGM